MRKSTKIAVVLAAAALLVAGFAFTTLAKGWVKEADGLYYYEDAEGMKVYNEWQKDGANYYYLGDDGYMVTNTLVEYTDSKSGELHYFWCGADGARVAEQWIAVPASDEDQENLEVDHRWYYFNKKGQAVSGQQTIGGETYFFTDDCKMVYGYVTVNAKKVVAWTTKVAEAYASGENDNYYCGSNDEGKALKGAWKQEELDTSSDTDESSDKFWAFYQANGKRAVAKETGYLWKGVRYYFDAEGKMVYGWEEATGSTPSKYFGDADDGKMVKKAWAYVKPRKNGDDKFWFYFDNGGSPIYTEDGAVKKINGRIYAFGPKEAKDTMNASRMLSGMVRVDLDENATIVEAKATEKVADVSTTYTLKKWLEDTTLESVYYFSGDEANDGSLKKNLAFQQEMLDDTYTLNVDAAGKLCNYYNEKSKKYYRNGYLLKASEDMRYEMVSVWKDNTTTEKVLLSSSGARVTTGTVTDADGSYYYVDADKVVFKADSSLISAAKAIASWKKDKGATAIKIEGEDYKVTANALKDGYRELVLTRVK